MATLARTACLLALAGASSASRPRLLLTSARTAAADVATLAAGGSLRGDWEEAVKEANEVSRLSDRIRQTQLKLEQWRRQLQSERSYHDTQTKNIQDQLKARERQQKHLKEQLENYEADQEKQIKGLMCNDLIHAFAFEGNQNLKVEIARTCNGLGLLAVNKKVSSHSLRALLLRATGGGRGVHALGPRLWTLALRTRHLVGATRRLEERCKRSGLCTSLMKGPSDDLKTHLQNLETMVEQARQEYKTKREGWAEQREKLSKEEQEAGDQVTSMHIAKAEARERAEAKVRGHFCPMVNSNYGLQEEKIVEYVQQECP